MVADGAAAAGAEVGAAGTVVAGVVGAVQPASQTPTLPSAAERTTRRRESRCLNAPPERVSKLLSDMFSFTFLPGECRSADGQVTWLAGRFMTLAGASD